MKVINVNSPEDFKVVKFNLNNGGFGIISNLDLEKLGDKNWTYYKAIVYFIPGTRGTKRIRLKELLDDENLYHVLDANRRNLTRENISPVIYDDGKNFYVRRVILVGDEYKEHQKVFPYENNREAQLERATFYRKELFRIKKETFLKNEEVPNWEFDGSTIRIPLGEGNFALIDEKDLPAIKQYSWKYYKRYGVITYIGSQRISLHSLIAPFPQVQFVNKDKKDCRRANLKRAELFPIHFNRQPHCKVRHEEKKGRYLIARYCKHEGKKIQTGFLFPYGPRKKYATQAEALEAANKALDGIRKMTKQDIVERVLTLRKTNTHDIIKGWSSFEDRVFTNSAVFRQNGKQVNTGFQVR